MSIVVKSLFLIERKLDRQLTLEIVAEFSACSSHHLSRVFTAATGRPVMRYIRDRRLSEAARKLASGASDVLQVALEAQFESHEAFGRAFRRNFDCTPSDVRSKASTNHLNLTEPFIMPTQNQSTPKPLLFELRPARRLVGLSGRFNSENIKTIPQIWERMNPYWNAIKRNVPGCAYGVSYGMDEDGFGYLAGLEVGADVAQDAELTTLEIPAQFCAVFEHRGHISAFQETFGRIWSEYFANTSVQAVKGYEMELYGERFRPDSENSVVEIEIPVDQETVPKA